MKLGIATNIMRLGFGYVFRMERCFYHEEEEMSITYEPTLIYRAAYERFRDHCQAGLLPQIKFIHESQLDDIDNLLSDIVNDGKGWVFSPETLPLLEMLGSENSWCIYKMWEARKDGIIEDAGP